MDFLVNSSLFIGGEAPDAIRKKTAVVMSFIFF